MIRIKGNRLPNLPWEERPRGCRDVLWRFSGNPVIRRDAIPSSNSIFNSAVVPFGDTFAGVFRCDNKARQMRLNAGFSSDGIRWEINPEPIRFLDAPEGLEHFEYGYDPRVCRIDDRYYITWCNWYHGPTIGVAYTFDFKEFHQMENAFLPYNRNGVLFPRRINGEFVMLSRPSDTGHTAFGDIFLSRSRDLVYWGKHRRVIGPSETYAWQSKKVGAGPIPIETSEGWLVFYHGVLNSCNGFVYSFGAMLLDLDDPARVLARGGNYLLSPQTLYECVGDVPNVTFPCAALTDPDTGRIAIYYGCADTVTGIAFGYVDEIIEEIRSNDMNSQVQTRL